jgi:hypothetical protein
MNVSQGQGEVGTDTPAGNSGAGKIFFFRIKTSSTDSVIYKIRQGRKGRQRHLQQ